MSAEERNAFFFTGLRAADSVKYYDTVLSHGSEGINMLYLAWDAAHKFGSRMTGENIASFRNGIVRGIRALEAAEYIDNAYKIAYASCEEYGRSKKMRALMQEVYVQAYRKFNVEIELL